MENIFDYARADDRCPVRCESGIMILIDADESLYRCDKCGHEDCG